MILLKMENIDIPSFRTARGKLVRIAAFLARRLRDGMRVNLHGVADSNRKKTRCKQAGNA
ncbi:hypothetical protein [Janthinobacterium sp. 78]|uniref:hypothetical protein n=2 Tax=unclassified Janthinobacterium TaxID=2610881 RepID=UPI0014028CDB|nr:hypothetical protein [Janthinobacterium sp. 78]